MRRGTHRDPRADTAAVVAASTTRDAALAPTMRATPHVSVQVSVARLHGNSRAKAARSYRPGDRHSCLLGVPRRMSPRIRARSPEALDGAALPATVTRGAEADAVSSGGMQVHVLHV